MATKKAPQKPRVHKFEKVIVSEGQYDQMNMITGKKTVKEVTLNDLHQAVATFNKMKEKGLRVPAPWKHDFGITALTKFEEGGSGILEDATRNAGFWDSLMVKVSPEGKPQLVGTIEVPGDPNDPNTPAGKIGTQVKDTSIYMRKNLPATDGSGEVLENALMHIALVINPIERNQSNFELLTEDDTYIAMSELIPGDNFDSTPLTELAEKLKSTCKLFLPPETTMQTLVPNLLAAIGQYALLCDEEDNDSSSPDPKNSKIKMEPIIMAHFNPAQVAALVASKAVNPATNKPFTEDDFKDPTPVAPSVAQLDPAQAMVMSALQSSLQSDRRQAFRRRIDGLVESSRTTKAFADQNLYPQADNYELQFANNQVVTPALETIIMSLESLPPPKVQDHEPHRGEGLIDYTEDDFKTMDDVAEEMANLL